VIQHQIKLRQLGLIAATDLVESNRLFCQQDSQPPPQEYSQISSVSTGSSSNGMKLDLSDDESVNSSQTLSQEQLSPEQIIDKEITTYREKGFGSGGESKDEFCKNILADWVKHKADFPCLFKVASVVFGMLPGSGGLECDIGGFKRIITAQRSRLSPGFVEALLMLNLNSSLFEYDITEIEELGDNWMNTIPKRPAYPENYVEEENDLDENEDTDNNDDNSFIHSLID